MLSIKEMVDKTEDQRKQIEYRLDQGFFDFNEASLLDGQGREDRQQLMESLRKISLDDIIKRSSDDLPWLKPKLKEFLAKSGTTGIAGAAYLIPEKIYQIMFDSAVCTDIVADISRVMIPADQIPGTTLRVDIAKDESYKPKKYSSGGKMPSETIETVKATLDFSTPFGINFPIANDLIEDSQFDLIEMHLSNAGREMGEFATNECLDVAYQAPDGDGTLNGGTATGDADETKWHTSNTTDVEALIKANCDDGFVSDLLVVPHECMIHSILSTSGLAYNESQVYNEFMHGGWPTQLGPLKVFYADTDIMTNDKAFTDCKTLVLTKDYSLVSGRKRWLRIEKYSDPIRDLVGATITARQDTVSIYKDSIAYMYET